MKVLFVKNYNGVEDGRLKRFIKDNTYDVQDKYAKVLIGIGAAAPVEDKRHKSTTNG